MSRKLKSLILAGLIATAPAVARASSDAPGSVQLAASSSLENCHQFAPQLVSPNGPNKLVGRIGVWWAGDSPEVVQLYDSASATPSGAPLWADVETSGEAIQPPPGTPGFSFKNGLLVCLSSNVSDPTAYTSAGAIGYFSTMFRSE
jgi:hypothetical protein